MRLWFLSTVILHALNFDLALFDSLKYSLHDTPGFLTGVGDGDDIDGEGKLAMPDILASLTKEQRKELAALRVDEKKWRKEDRKKKRKKKSKRRRDADTGDSSSDDSDTKEKRHRHKRRSHKLKKVSKKDAHRSHRRRHHHSDSSSTDTSSESDHAGTASEPRDFSSRKTVEGSEDDSVVDRRERHHRHRHRSSRSKGAEVHAKERDHHDREQEKARDTVLDEVHESFKQQRRKEHRKHRHEELPTTSRQKQIEITTRWEFVH